MTDDTTAPPGPALSNSGNDFSIIGRRNLKYDWPAKLTGAAKYTYDLKLPRMIYGRLLRSPHPHACILGIETSRAEALPGVFAVLTGKDLPIKYGILPSSQDETALAVEKPGRKMKRWISLSLIAASSTSEARP